MKKLVLFLVSIISLNCFAYGSNVFDYMYYDTGGYVGLQMKTFEMNDDPELMLGAKGAWVFDHRYVIGGAIYGLVDDINDEYDDFYFGYGGILLGYIINPQDPVHLTFDFLFGLGDAGYRYDTYWDDYEHEGFYVFEPGINLEINLTENLRLETGMSYLFIDGLDLPNSFTGGKDLEEDIEGWQGNVSFKYGLF